MKVLLEAEAIEVAAATEGTKELYSNATKEARKTTSRELQGQKQRQLKIP